MMIKTYPDRTLEMKLRTMDYSVRVNWEIRGPKNTGVEWMTCLTIGSPKGAGVVIVQTYTHGGWEAYVPASNANSIDATVKAVAQSINPERITA